MRNLANCTPDEFMAQVVKVRGPFVEWVKRVGTEEFRKVYADKLADENVVNRAKALSMYLGEIIMASMEKEPELTKELLCLTTFTEIEDFNSHRMLEYISAVFEMYRSRDMRDFFTLFLAPSLQTFTEL